MEKPPYTAIDEINDISMAAPHVVILGAGASIAATPHGDLHGKKLPSMANFVDVLGLRAVLDSFDIPYQTGDNFEVVYASVAADPTKKVAAFAIEQAVVDYFSDLRLPDTATVYDRLVLSLRGKDLIATFNWDPFLYMACYRNRLVGELPHVVYLHGSVATAYCFEHKKKSTPGASCSVCREPLIPSKLLFPIEQKNYSEDKFINAEWKGPASRPESSLPHNRLRLRRSSL